MRQVYSSGFCYTIPDEKELTKESVSQEYMKLGFDRIPAVGDIRYYDKYDRLGNKVERGCFIIETVTGVDVENIHKISGYNETSKWHEKIEATVNISYSVSEYKETNPTMWEKDEHIEV